MLGENAGTGFQRFLGAEAWPLPSVGIPFHGI
jgi:hypothetical protein